MPCCGRTPFEVPRTDRMTTDADAVTCKPNRVIEPTSQEGIKPTSSNAERQRPAGATEDACLHKVAVSEVP
jgi:hypothetical protein